MICLIIEEFNYLKYVSLVVQTTPSKIIQYLLACKSTLSAVKCVPAHSILEMSRLQIMK